MKALEATESYGSRIAPGTTLDVDQVLAMIADQNDRDDPYEGPVPAYVLRYSKYLCAQVPIASCDLNGHGYDPALAQEYSQTPANRFPPIVLDLVDGRILDGYHRTHAALLRGEATVLALIGITGTADPQWTCP